MVEKRRWWKGICILGIVLAITLFLTTPTLAWWNTDWKYRRPITIQSENALSDYQVLVQLNGTNFDFSKANPDGSDIRFVDEDDATKLSYWIEEWDSVNETAKIWVNITSIPAGEKTIYLYYNNSEAVSESDGSATFDFFDDFETYSLGDLQGQDGWYSVNYGNAYASGTIDVQDAEVAHNSQAVQGTNSGTEMVCKDIDLSLTKFILEYKFKYEDTGNTIAVVLKDSGGNWAGVGVNPPGSLNTNPVYATGSDTWSGFGSNIAYPSSWFDVIMKFDGNSYDYIEVNGQTTSATLSYSLSDIKSVCMADRGRDAWGRWDLIKIRKYTDPEPSVSVGAEEECTSLPQDPNLQITCIPPFTLKVSLTFPESGYILIGTSPDKYCYVFSHKGSGEYTLTASFVRVNTTYYAKACDSEGVNCTNTSLFVCEEGVEVEEKNFTTAYNKLMQGGDVLNISKLSNTIPSIYTTLLTDMFWAMFFGGIFLAYWIRQEDVMLPSIVGLITGSVLIVMLPPSAQHIAYILLVISIAGTLYTIIKARR